eukprot:2636406-Rhodomonas_salina.2
MDTLRCEEEEDVKEEVEQKGRSGVSFCQPEHLTGIESGDNLLASSWKPPPVTEMLVPAELIELGVAERIVSARQQQPISVLFIMIL